jgi:hypothetical protein
MILSTRVSDDDMGVIIRTHYDAGANKGYPSRYAVRNTIHTGMGLRI